MTEQLYRWVNGNKKELHPEIDNSDLPITYTVRFNGDDPHTGWVSSKQMTAAQIRDCDYSDYWEWLEPYSPSLNAGSLEETAKEGLDVDVNDIAAMYAHQNKKIVDGYYNTENDLEQAFLWAAEWQSAKSSRPFLDIDKVVDGLKEIEKLSRYDANHDNMLYNIQEINKLAKELLNQKEGK